MTIALALEPCSVLCRRRTVGPEAHPSASVVQSRLEAIRRRQPSASRSWNTPISLSATSRWSFCAAARTLPPDASASRSLRAAAPKPAPAPRPDVEASGCWPPLASEGCALSRAPAPPAAPVPGTAGPAPARCAAAAGFGGATSA